MNLSKDYKPNQSKGFLLLGFPGAGKTTAALQIAQPAAYIADLDNNLSGAHRFLQGKVEFLFDIPTNYIEFSQQIKEVSKAASVNSIIIDSLSSLTDIAVDEILRQQGRKVMQLQDWGIFLVMMKRLIVEMRSTKKLFIACAHMQPEKDEVSGLVRYFPSVPGKLQNQIGMLFSDVLLCEVEERSGKYSYNIRTMSDTRNALKNSLGLPPVTNAETIRKVLAETDK